MVQEEVLFIFGAPRSGTTYLNAMIRQHFSYGLCAEGEFVLKYAKRLHRYGPLDQQESLRTLIDDICADRMLEHFRTEYSRYFRTPLDVRPADVLKKLPQPTYPGVIYSVFSCVAEQLKCKRVGNKNPDYYRILPQLLEWFPKAKFLHVVRDGRDVALSTLKEPWGETSIFACARKWATVEAMTESFTALIPPSQFHTLYYESLLNKPKTAIAELDRFLGTSLDERAQAAVVEEIQANPLRANHGKWRAAMTSQDVRIFEGIAGDWLRKHGYESGSANPRVFVRERIWYTGKEVARRIKVKSASLMHQSRKAAE